MQLTFSHNHIYLQSPLALTAKPISNYPSVKQKLHYINNTLCGTANFQWSILMKMNKLRKDMRLFKERSLGTGSQEADH